MNSASVLAERWLTQCAVWDLINVAEIHNATFDPTDIVTTNVFDQLYNYANIHEWGLAYNASDDMRAVTGMTLAAQVVQALNTTITGKGKTTLNIQFGAYGSFSSFFGLADVEANHPEIMGIADYASAMTWELFTNTSTPVTSTTYPSTDEIYVRFLFHNGTTSNTSEPTVYPLFGTGQDTIGWNDFTTGMNKFALGTTEAWCVACGNFTGTCAAYAPSSSSSSSSGSSGSSSGAGGNGLSPAVNGVIGAMVTLAVLLGTAAVVMLVGGYKLVSKKSLARGAGAVGGNGAAKA